MLLEVVELVFNAAGLILELVLQICSDNKHLDNT